MINSLEFATRLKKIIDFYDESASSFAEKIGVQRSSISHILSGRNKPSLDFVMKILNAYPEVDLYWLMNNKGEFPKVEINASELLDHSPTLTKSSETIPTKTENNLQISSKSSQQDSTIERIVIFYKDGTFKSYNPKEK